MSIPELIEQISLIISKHIERVIRYSKKYKIYILLSLAVSIIIGAFIILRFKIAVNAILTPLITLYSAILIQFVFVAYKEIQKENQKKEELSEVNSQLDALGKHPEDTDVKDLLQKMYQSVMMENLSKK